MSRPHFCPDRLSAEAATLGWWRRHLRLLRRPGGLRVVEHADAGPGGAGTWAALRRPPDAARAAPAVATSPQGPTRLRPPWVSQKRGTPGRARKLQRYAWCRRGAPVPGSLSSCPFGGKGGGGLGNSDPKLAPSYIILPRGRPLCPGPDTSGECDLLSFGASSSRPRHPPPSLVSAVCRSSDSCVSSL